MASTHYYEHCPRYGTGNCCGEIHNSIRAKLERHKITLQYLDRRPNKEIVCFELRDPRYEWPGSWQSLKLESEEIVEAAQQFQFLTTESTEAIKDIHSGVVNTSMYDDCPLRAVLG